MVFTTKHHDGFCMFDSSHTDYKITNTPYGKDVVRQLADACQGRDMPLGFYYSPPENDRIGVPGDYQTPEQFIPNAIPTKGVRFAATDASVQQELKRVIPPPEDFQFWETCMTINKTWAYNANDREYKPAEFLIRSLVEVASRGGNFLLNVGPQPDGLIQPEFQQRLRAIGDWLAINGESIYGTTYGPVQNMKSVRTTAKPGRLFLHIFDWPSSPLEISGLAAKVVSAHLLARGPSLKFRRTERRFQIDLPQQPPDSNVTVIAVRTL
jgi:alpha-L-fucosidase